MRDRGRNRNKSIRRVGNGKRRKGMRKGKKEKTVTIT